MVVEPPRLPSFRWNRLEWYRTTFFAFGAESPRRRSTDSSAMVARASECAACAALHAQGEECAGDLLLRGLQPPGNVGLQTGTNQTQRHTDARPGQTHHFPGRERQSHEATLGIQAAR